MQTDVVSVVSALGLYELHSSSHWIDWR